MLIEKTNRKSFTIRESGRSTDFISPSFGHGCLYDCTYCYMKRHKPDGLDIAKNTGDILTEISSHAYFAVVDKPNQTHESYVTYDIACNEDFALHSKFHNWKRIFEFFRTHPVAMASLATKYVNKSLLEFNPEGKVRIRFSLMPDKYSEILEQDTSSIDERIDAIDEFIEAGYDVHINFSPVIVTDGWLDEYAKLFQKVDERVKNKDKVKCEVIFLTHNRDKHEYNVENELPGEELIWRPDIQEDKISSYGGNNLRYKWDLKSQYIKDFKYLHSQIIPWCTIRYIF
jgi:spore photoproduct lyase